jgi:hypothetical protein
MPPKITRATSKGAIPPSNFFKTPKTNNTVKKSTTRIEENNMENNPTTSQQISSTQSTTQTSAKRSQSLGDIQQQDDSSLINPGQLTGQEPQEEVIETQATHERVNTQDEINLKLLRELETGTPDNTAAIKIGRAHV